MTEVGAQSIPSEICVLLDMVGNKALQKAAYRVPPDLWLLTRDKLESTVTPTASWHRLRAAFWTGVRTTVADGRKMDLRAICTRGESSYAHGYFLMTQDPAFLVWMLEPGYNLKESISYLVGDVAEKIHEILALPICDSKNRPIVRNLNCMLRVSGLVLGISPGVSSTCPRNSKF